MYGFSDNQERIINDQFQKMIRKLKKKLGNSKEKSIVNDSEKE